MTTAFLTTAFLVAAADGSPRAAEQPKDAGRYGDRAAIDSEPTSVTSPSRASARDGLHVLVVEDEPANAQLIVNTIADAWASDAEIGVVQDGRDALEYLHRNHRYANASRPDIVLLDLNLPGIDGREVLRDIAGDEELRPIPVVVLTTSDSVDDRRTCEELGAARFITKPTRLAQLETELVAIGELVAR